MSGHVIAVGVDSGFNSKAARQISGLFSTAVKMDKDAQLFLLKAAHSNSPFLRTEKEYTQFSADFFGDYPPDQAAALLDKLLPRVPAVWLFGPGTASRATALHFAAKRGLPCAANIEQAAFLENGDLQLKRLVYAGNLSALLRLPPDAVAALNAAALGEEAGAEPSAPAALIRLQAQQPPLGLTISRDEREDPLAKAQSLVCVGRGVGSREGLDRVRQLAEKLGAQLAASRPVVSSGWLSANRLLGISGQSVSPEQCLLLGLSGSRAFMYGLSGAKQILAVNTDKDAEIFSAAGYGTICSLEEMCDILERKLSELSDSAE